MKPLFTLLTVLFIATTGFSQDVVSQYEVNDTFEGQAQKLTASYDAELGLQADQRILFQKKVEEYLILSQEAKDQLLSLNLANTVVQPMERAMLILEPITVNSFPKKSSILKK